MINEPCPTTTRLDDYLEGRSDPDELSRIEAHIGCCDQCRHVMAALVRRTVPARPEQSSLDG
jgi:anti-sigma factor RsiW